MKLVLVVLVFFCFLIHQKSLNSISKRLFFKNKISISCWIICGSSFATVESYNEFSYFYVENEKIKVYIYFDIKWQKCNVVFWNPSLSMNNGTIFVENGLKQANFKKSCDLATSNFDLKINELFFFLSSTKRSCFIINSEQNSPILINDCFLKMLFFWECEEGNFFNVLLK